MSDTNYKQKIIDMATRITQAADDADKFDRGQDAAGARLRSLFLDITKLCKEHRLDIQEIRKTRKETK